MNSHLARALADLHAGREQATPKTSASGKPAAEKAAQSAEKPDTNQPSTKES